MRDTRSQVSRYHECGGEIHSDGGAEGDPTAHVYCERCHAFTHDFAAEVPTGTDEAANRAAWDEGEEQSPDA